MNVPVHVPVFFSITVLNASILTDSDKLSQQKLPVDPTSKTDVRPVRKRRRHRNDDKG